MEKFKTVPNTKYLNLVMGNRSTKYLTLCMDNRKPKYLDLHMDNRSTQHFYLFRARATRLWRIYFYSCQTGLRSICFFSWATKFRVFIYSLVTRLRSTYLYLSVPSKFEACSYLVAFNKRTKNLKVPRYLDLSIRNTKYLHPFSYQQDYGVTEVVHLWTEGLVLPSFFTFCGKGH